MAPAGGGDEAGGSGGLRMRRGVDRSAAADGYGGGGSPSASTSEEESGLAGRSGGRDERGAEQRRTGSGGGKGWGARARTGAEDLWWRGGRGGPAEDECGPAGSGAAGASACPYWQKRLLPAGGGRKGQNLGVESGSRKRKSAVKSEDSISLVGNGEHLKVPHEHSQSILKEIEDLRAQLDEDVKKLGYCEANQKLGVALTMKVGEMQCLRKQNEEMQGKSNGMRKQNEELQAMNDGLAKLNKELRAKNDGLVKENEELRTNMDSMMKRNGVLQVNNGSLTKWSWELQAKIGGLAKQIEELQAKNDGLTKQNEELQAKHVALVKQNEEVQTNNDSMKKKNGELQAKNCVLTKHNEELQAKNDSLTKWIEELEANNDGLEDLNGSLVRKERQSNDELQQARKELTVVLEEKSNGQTAIEIKRMGELDEKPFQNACKRKYGNDDYQTKAAELVAIWRDEIKKPSWHPFMVVQVNGEQKEVVDDNDAKLKLLRSEYGDDVCDAVKTALMEINKYSPSERCAVPQFWNFKKGRKATTREALKYLF